MLFTDPSLLHLQFSAVVGAWKFVVVFEGLEVRALEVLWWLKFVVKVFVPKDFLYC